MILKWKKGFPKKPGIYLRNNPAVQYVVRQDIFLIDGKLWAGGEQMTLLERWPACKTFWWYGPIPKPPK